MPHNPLQKSIPCFARSDVKDVEYKTLAGRIVYEKYPKGHVFYKKGGADESGIYFVHSGKVKMDSMKAEVTEGGYFGVTDTILSDVNNANAVATEDCEVGYLSKLAIKTVISQLQRLEEGSKKQMKTMSSVITEYIPLESLKKHRILGCGTFGKVWLVTKGDSDESFALKIQKKRALIEHQQVEGVMREMNVMATLDHPFVLKLVSVYQNPDSVLMLVRLVQGGELYGVMKKARKNILPERDSKFYAAGILEGLSYMHSNSILYRDLKPEVCTRRNHYFLSFLCVTRILS